MMDKQKIYNFMGINENLLSAKDRRELPEDSFGLPVQRKYPLNDEDHIRKAIQFFKFCPAFQKKVLAININKRAKLLNMKIKINHDNPFYKYADKHIITESLGSTNHLALEGLVDIPEYGNINTKVSEILDDIQSKMMTSGGELLDFEKSLQENIIPQLVTSCKNDIESGLHMMNPLRLLNMIMQNQYTTVFLYGHFIVGPSTQEDNEIFYNIISDICYTMYAKISGTDKNIKAQISILQNLIDHFSCNIFHIERKVQEVLFDCYIHRRELSINSEEIISFDTLKSMEDHLNDFLSSIKDKESSMLSILSFPKEIMDSVLKSSDMNLLNTKNYLNNLKDQLKNQINIIMMTNQISCVRDQFNDDKTFLLKDVPRDNIDIFNIIEYLPEMILSRNIKYYNKDYSLYLDSKDLLTFTGLRNLLDNIYMTHDKYGSDIYFGINKDKLYILGKTNIAGEVIMIKLYDCKNLNVENNFTTTDPSKLTPMTISKINILMNEKENTLLLSNILTEGLDIDKEGNIRYEMKPKKSYMDEYADNHRLLLVNLKTKNYDAAKKNLAFLFALISIIERDVIYNKKTRITDDQRIDAEKARTFAINDFKTYLKEIQKVDPKFDFTKFYEDGGYGSLVINISHDSILGIKKLFKTIMLA